MYWSKIKSISVLFNHFDIMSHCILSFILNKKPLGSLKWSNNAAFSEAQQKQIHLLSREKCAQNCAHRTTTAKIKRCTHKDYCIYEKALWVSTKARHNHLYTRNVSRNNSCSCKCEYTNFDKYIFIKWNFKKWTL